ncbi:MAG: hypothetical protein KGH61_05485 [Candidatus Micrarchaeota archaeon]|nr:hypothetical protein [Candidatus Micrarchaeota archaeon]MDE1848366.1 hypothetical protein [Candidatus Micrarchaeota archaeon]MDE1864575.1 hypothetical protein [Candidatus Micrarchaeota archaeon]
MNIAIDLGKKKSYVVMEENKTIVREGYVETSKYGFSTFFGEVADATIIVEACSSLARISTFFEGHKIIAVHPVKVKMIAESVKKTDKIDAHTLLELYNAGYLPKAYLPERERQ